MIQYLEQAREFHLSNRALSYVIHILENGQLANLYYGKRLHARESFAYLYEEDALRPLTPYWDETHPGLSLQMIRQEYPASGGMDFREPAFTLAQQDGSLTSEFSYVSHKIEAGKPKLPGLPATYVDVETEAETLTILMHDAHTDTDLQLLYTVYTGLPVLARSARFLHHGADPVTLTRAFGMSVDLADDCFELVQLSGAWARERFISRTPVRRGVQAIGSTRGASSAEHNPFLALVRPETTETTGEAYGFSHVYSGNFLAQAEVDTHGQTRVQMGIHPAGFSWKLCAGESFQTPETVMVYSDEGLGAMSRAYHQLYRTRLARGVWRDRDRPILINNWEATEADFQEARVLQIARAGQELGMELFVLDDGWFGARDDDTAGLGDWYVTNFDKLPQGIHGLAEKVETMGMRFGLWIEPEMVNKDSDLFRAHPDWVLAAPGRTPSPARHQFVLDFSRAEVVDAVCEMLAKLLREAKISYIKWDMNRYITQCWSAGCPPEEQGKVMHRYILGVYALYERLTSEFPEILFESCASGGARFDPGMLYYAPQAWTSDDTDAIERLKIQYGTSMVYPVVSMGAHVSVTPNQQVQRTTPLETRGNVALFGAFGYELDLCQLTQAEKEMVRAQVSFAKAHRGLIRTGDFYRLLDPFRQDAGAWMVVSPDRSRALAGYYRLLTHANEGGRRLRLAGLDEDAAYRLNGGQAYYGSELMHAGIVIRSGELCAGGKDFSSALFELERVNA